MEKPVALLTMGDVQVLITAVNESNLSEGHREAIRAKLDKMETALMHVSQLVVK